MTNDQNDGIAKVINALTGAVVAFKDRDLGLHFQSKEALTRVLSDVGYGTSLNSAPDIDGNRDPSRLIPWQPEIRLVEDPETNSWKVLVDHVDIGWTYDSYEKADIAYWAVSNAIDRMCKYSRSAADEFYRSQI